MCFFLELKNIFTYIYFFEINIDDFVRIFFIIIKYHLTIVNNFVRIVF